MIPGQRFRRRYHQSADVVDLTSSSFVSFLCFGIAVHAMSFLLLPHIIISSTSHLRAINVTHNCLKVQTMIHLSLRSQERASLLSLASLLRYSSVSLSFPYASSMLSLDLRLAWSQVYAIRDG